MFALTGVRDRWILETGFQIQIKIPHDRQSFPVRCPKQGIENMYAIFTHIPKNSK
jgi:hypothetical protein